MVDDGAAAKSAGQSPPNTVVSRPVHLQRYLRHVALRLSRIRGRGFATGTDSLTFQGLSLDVFDTSLVRVSGPPVGLYLLLGNRLAHRGDIPCTPEIFARVRAQAEADVWAREGGLDARVKLEDFYRELVRVLGLDPATQDGLVAAELELEAQLLRPTTQAKELLARCDAMGASTVFLSDAYLDEAFIVAQLQRHDVWRPGARVISSADYDTSKATGGLFEIALDALEVPRGQIIHAGDNPRSDVASARLHGIRPLELPDGRLNRYEALLADHMWATGGLGACFAGASRLARLSVTATSSRETAIRDVAAGVAAPFLTSYVLWLLHQANEAGLERLYFIARDGQVMVDIARQLVKLLDLDLEVSYLYASRDSVNFAATFEFNDDELAWVQRDLPHLTPSELLDRFDLDWQDIASLPCNLDFSPDADQGADHVHKLFRKMRDTAVLRKAALARAELRRQDVIRYLSHEGLIDDSSCGLVDFGGVGSQMRALHTLIVKAGGKPPKIYLIGLDRPEDAGLTTPVGTPDWLRDTRCFLYDHRRDSGTKRRRGFGTCVQMFCAADHGTVTGYMDSDGGPKPVLSENIDQEILTWGLPLMRKAIQAFVDNLVLEGELVDSAADVHAAVTANIDVFWSEPTTAEAEAWGRFPFEGAQASGHTRFRLAHRYRVLDVVRGVADGTFPKLGWMHWYEGSLRLSSRLVAVPLDAAIHLYRHAEQSQTRLARRAVPIIRRWAGR